MVGRALERYCRTKGDDVYPYGHSELNIADEEAVGAALVRDRPETVINCAAWTDVDGCERDAGKAYESNARGPQVLAQECRRAGSSLVTISTDYVFDGAKDGFYTQRDDPHPQSVYGRVKLEGERLAQAASARTVVVRTGWIFGAGGRNFLSRVIEYARQNATLKAITDSYGTPTYAPHLAARLRELAALDLPGVYHVTNDGEGVSFAEFTRAALDAAQVTDATVEPVLMDSLVRPAARPRNSRLRCLLSPALGLAPLPDWRAAVDDFVSPQKST